MKLKIPSGISQTVLTATLTGAMAFGLWLFEPLGLTSQEWNFVDMPSVPMTVVIFFIAGIVPATGLTFLLPRFRNRFRQPGEQDSSFFRGLCLGPLGGLFLILICLPGLGRVHYHHAGDAVTVLSFFIMIPSSILGGLVGVYLPRRMRYAALVPAVIFASAMTGYLFLKVVVRILI